MEIYYEKPIFSIGRYDSGNFDRGGGVNNNAGAMKPLTVESMYANLVTDHVDSDTFGAKDRYAFGGEDYRLPHADRLRLSEMLLRNSRDSRVRFCAATRTFGPSLGARPSPELLRTAAQYIEDHHCDWGEDITQYMNVELIETYLREAALILHPEETLDDKNQGNRIDAAIAILMRPHYGHDQEVLIHAARIVIQYKEDHKHPHALQEAQRIGQH
jgi:hypothetical protein